MTDVLELLKKADPADGARVCDAPPPRERLEAILATERPETPRRPRRRRSPLRLAVPAAGLAAIAAAVVLLTTGGDGRTVDTAAAAVLEDLADVARAQPPTLPPGDDRFLYFRLDSHGFLAMADEPPFNRGIRTRDDFGFLLEFEAIHEVWIGEDRGRARSRADAPTFPTAADRSAWEAAGRPKLPRAVDDEFPLDQGIERLRIPTDPDALLEDLRERAERNGEGNAWIFGTMIADYLREWGVTPEQRAALFGAAARLPGVQLLGERNDPAGRPGVAFAMAEESGERHTLILDRDTGELLAQLSETLPGGPMPPGVISSSVFHSPVLVDAPGELPD
jgi:hypothetical protein